MVTVGLSMTRLAAIGVGVSGVLATTRSALDLSPAMLAGSRIRGRRSGVTMPSDPRQSRRAAVVVNDPLDVAIIESHNLADWLRVTSRVMIPGTRVDDRHTTPHAQHIQIRMRSPMPPQADGALIGDGAGMDVQIGVGAMPSPSPPLPRDRMRATPNRPGVRGPATSKTTEVKAG